MFPLSTAQLRGVLIDLKTIAKWLKDNSDDENYPAELSDIVSMCEEIKQVF